MQLRVLSLNIWGVHYVAKHVHQRIDALIDYLKNQDNNYDIIGLQEVWSKTDFVRIRDGIREIYPYSHYFLSGLIGSGCCMFSKYPIIGVYEHRYSLNGFPHKIQHGDYFAGKLICLCKILVDRHVINVYNTHLHANYHHIVPDDIYLGHRICQAYELVQFIESTSSADTTYLTILLGDLNLREHELGFQLIRHVLHLHDSFIDRHDKEKCDPTVGNSGVTCDVPGNPYAAVRPGKYQGERIDYILFRGKNDNVKCLVAYPTLNKVPRNANGIHYSDHLAMFAQLEIDETMEKSDGRSFEKLDAHSQELLNQSSSIVEETIKRIERDRILWIFGLFILVFLLFSLNVNIFTSNYTCIVLMILKNLFSLIGISISLWFIFLGKAVERNALHSVLNAMRVRLQATHFSY